MAEQRVFWEDLAQDLEDPEFLGEYVVESVRIATLDRIINDPNEEREEAGLSKAQVARSINAGEPSIRRLLTGAHGNPTLSTVSEVAAALGFRVALVPLTAAERKTVTRPLRDGHPGNAKALAESLVEMRTAAGGQKAAV